MIEMVGVSKRYVDGSGKSVNVLHDVNLFIDQGERVAVVGKSGSGKSTLLHILGCLEPPTSGSYRLNGQEIPWGSDRKLAALRNRHIGFIFQEFMLIAGLNVWENVAIPAIHGGMLPRAAKRRAEELLERLDLGSYAQRKVEALSGGQRQRVAIARALVNDPVLLLADEPTGALDWDTGQQVMEMLLGLDDKRRTLVVVTHDPDVAHMCDRSIEIHRGQVAEPMQALVN